MDSLKKVEGKDLRVVVEALEVKKENEWAAMGGRLEMEYISKHDFAGKTEPLSEVQKNDEAKKKRRLGRLPLE